LQRVAKFADLDKLGLLPASLKRIGAKACAPAAGMGLAGAKLTAASLGALLTKLQPTRLLVLAEHCWVHALSGSGETRPSDYTMFEVGAEGAASLDGGALLASLEGIMPYMFREEDRLAEGARYEPSTGQPQLGRPCPPRMAAVMGAVVDPRTSIVTRAGFLGMAGVISMGPPFDSVHQSLSCNAVICTTTLKASKKIRPLTTPNMAPKIRSTGLKPTTEMIFFMSAEINPAMNTLAMKTKTNPAAYRRV
jgi:hypothetical protein